MYTCLREPREGMFFHNLHAADTSQQKWSRSPLNLAGGSETLACYICIVSLPAAHFYSFTCSPVWKFILIYVSVLSVVKFFLSVFFLCGNPPLHLWPLMFSSLFSVTTLARSVFIMLVFHIFASVHRFCCQSRTWVQIWLRARHLFLALVTQPIFLIVNGLIIFPTQDTLWLLLLEGSNLFQKHRVWRGETMGLMTATQTGHTGRD